MATSLLTRLSTAGVAQPETRAAPIRMVPACKWRDDLNAVQARFIYLNDALIWVFYSVGEAMTFMVESRHRPPAILVLDARQPC